MRIFSSLRGRPAAAHDSYLRVGEILRIAAHK
jgi:hypothetical protein